MGKIIVTLMNSKTNHVVTITAPHRSGQFVAQVHKNILKGYPGYHIRKSKTL